MDPPFYNIFILFGIIKLESKSSFLSNGLSFKKLNDTLTSFDVTFNGDLPPGL